MFLIHFWQRFLWFLQVNCTRELIKVWCKGLITISCFFLLVVWIYLSVDKVTVHFLILYVLWPRLIRDDTHCYSIYATWIVAASVQIEACSSQFIEQIESSVYQINYDIVCDKKMNAQIYVSYKAKCIFLLLQSICPVKLDENRLQNCFVHMQLLHNRWIGWSVTKVVTQCVRGKSLRDHTNNGWKGDVDFSQYEAFFPLGLL